MCYRFIFRIHSTRRFRMGSNIVFCSVFWEYTSSTFRDVLTSQLCKRLKSPITCKTQVVCQITPVKLWFNYALWFEDRFRDNYNVACLERLLRFPFFQVHWLKELCEVFSCVPWSTSQTPSTSQSLFTPNHSPKNRTRDLGLPHRDLQVHVLPYPTARHRRRLQVLYHGRGRQREWT